MSEEDAMTGAETVVDDYRPKIWTDQDLTALADLTSPDVHDSVAP